MTMEDYRFEKAIEKLLYMIHNHFKYKVGLAIYIISEETGFSTRELSHHLYKIKVLKRDKEVERTIRREPKIDYRKVYRG